MPIVGVKLKSSLAFNAMQSVVEVCLIDFSVFKNPDFTCLAIKHNQVQCFCRL